MSQMKKPIFKISKKIIFEKIKQLEEIFDEISYSWKSNPKIGEIIAEKKKHFISIHGLKEFEQLKIIHNIRYFTFATA